MTIYITNGVHTFNVEIKAKKEYHARYNEEDTKALLNLFSILMDKDCLEMANQYQTIAKQNSKEIYKTLEAKGSYYK